LCGYERSGEDDGIKVGFLMRAGGRRHAGAVPEHAERFYRSLRDPGAFFSACVHFKKKRQDHAVLPFSPAGGGVGSPHAAAADAYF
jgi:hypothetical protein